MATLSKSWGTATELTVTPAFGGSDAVLEADQAYDYTSDVDLETSGYQGAQVLIETKLNFSSSRGRGASAVPGAIIVDVFASLDGSLYDTIPYASYTIEGRPDGDFRRLSFIVNDLAHFRIGLKTSDTNDTYDYRITYQAWYTDNS